MTARRPKDIGTAAETAVVNYLRENGWPSAERRALHGNTDLGDVTGTPGLVWEVKGGDAAKTASDRQILDWLDETEAERANDRAAFGLLITARYRKSTGDWWAHLFADMLARLAGSQDSEVSETSMGIPVRLLLRDACRMLRESGWGDEPTN